MEKEQKHESDRDEEVDRDDVGAGERGEKNCFRSVFCPGYVLPLYFARLPGSKPFVGSDRFSERPCRTKYLISRHV